MNNIPFSGIGERNGYHTYEYSASDAKFLEELSSVLWQRFHQTLPEVLTDLVRQNAISTPQLPVERIVKELSKISSVQSAIAPVVEKYRKEL